MLLDTTVRIRKNCFIHSMSSLDTQSVDSVSPSVVGDNGSGNAARPAWRKTQKQVYDGDADSETRHSTDTSTRPAPSTPRKALHESVRVVQDFDTPETKNQQRQEEVSPTGRRIRQLKERSRKMLTISLIKLSTAPISQAAVLLNDS